MKNIQKHTQELSSLHEGKFITIRLDYNHSESVFVFFCFKNDLLFITVFFFQDYLLHSFRKGAVWVSVSLLKQSKSLQLRIAAISTITVNLAIRTVCYSDSKENHFQATRQKCRSWRKREHAHSKGTNATQQLILE